MILLDVVKQYDTEKITFLRDLREKIIHHMAIDHDTKKIISFLNHCGILAVDENEKSVYVGTPNEFVSTQVKKFFSKPLNNSLQAVYSDQFKIKISVYNDFQLGKNPLQLNLKKVLDIKDEMYMPMLDANTKKTLKDEFGVLFDNNYRFDNFVVGSHSEMAFSAAQAVSQKPGHAYNPFFLYGNVGLGKTHLLQAIANGVIQQDSKKVVVYLPTSKLIEDIIDGIKKNKLSQEMKKFDNVDVLILDDIQFLAEKEKTQEIFHNLFNDFYSKKKQIIMSSDRPPKDLGMIEARLKSRFALGLVCDIQAPDFETRIAILDAKIKQKQENIPAEFVSIIAQVVKDNVRELEGALNILLTKKNLLKKELVEQDVYDGLKTLGYKIENSGEGTAIPQRQTTKSAGNFSKIVDYVSHYYTISALEIKSDKRTKEVSLARQMLMYIAKKYFNRTLEKIGDYMGGKNHATVIYAIKTFERQLKFDKNLQHDFNVISDAIEK